MTERQKPFKGSDSSEASKPFESSETSASSQTASIKLFVGNLPWETDSDELEPLFEKYGKVTDCQVVYDDQGRSRGFGFLEMASREEGLRAIKALDGSIHDGRELRVEEADAASNDNSEEPSQRDAEPVKLFVGNLPWETDGDELESLFKKHGIVSECKLVYDDQGQSRGFGFVTMGSEAAAKSAIDELDGATHGGRELRVEEASGEAGGASDQSLNFWKILLSPLRFLTSNSSSEQSQEPITQATEPVKLFVGNLPWETENDELESLFEEYGNVTDCNVVYDDQGQSRGFGFVTMGSEAAAKSAIDELDGATHGGRELRVEEADS